MDPNLNLKMIRTLVTQINHTFDTDCDRSLTPSETNILKQRAYDLAALVEALDEWMVKGGFTPSEWDKNP